jgi:hypothetical protein
VPNVTLISLCRLWYRHINIKYIILNHHDLGQIKRIACNTQRVASHYDNIYIFFNFTIDANLIFINILYLIKMLNCENNNCQSTYLNYVNVDLKLVILDRESSMLQFFIKALALGLTFF